MSTTIHNEKDLFDCTTEEEARAWLNSSSLTFYQRLQFFDSWLVGRKKTPGEIQQAHEAMESAKQRQSAHEEARSLVSKWAAITGRTGGKWKASRKSKIAQVQRALLKGTFNPESLNA